MLARSSPIAAPRFWDRHLAFDSAGNLFVLNGADTSIDEFNSSGTGKFFANVGAESYGAWYLAFQPIPEPSTFLLAALGGVSVIAFLKRKRG